jgi:hypothetical protein
MLQIIDIRARRPGFGDVMNRLFFFAAIGGVLVSQSALADTRDEVYARMQRCRALQDDRAWLDCTYGAEQPMRAKLGLQPAPDFQQRLLPLPTASAGPANPGPAYVAPANAAPRNAPPAAVSHRSASFLQILTGSAPAVAASPLASMRYDAAGAFIATLENGQVWRQVNADGDHVRFRAGARVTVKPAAFGSYDFQASDNPHVYKVKPNA